MQLCSVWNRQKNLLHIFVLWVKNVHLLLFLTSTITNSKSSQVLFDVGLAVNGYQLGQEIGLMTAVYRKPKHIHNLTSILLHPRPHAVRIITIIHKRNLCLYPPVNIKLIDMRITSWTIYRHLLQDRMAIQLIYTIMIIKHNVPISKVRRCLLAECGTFG